MFSAAQPGALDLSFDPGTGANSEILATTIQSDGKIIIGGTFDWYNGTAITRLARLHTNGSLDTSFNIGTGAGYTVHALAIQSDGKIIAGGQFTTFDGTPANYLLRLNADGSRDTAFNIGTGFNNTVKAIAIQSDGKIVTGGAFTACNGFLRNRIVRLHTNGSVDTGFNPGTGANGAIETMAIQADGKIVIGGSFTIYATSACLRLARVNTDGSPDTGFNPLLGGTNSNVFAIAIQNDQKIILGGDFTNYNSQPNNRLLRILTNGDIDGPTFNIGQGVNSTVSAIQILGNGKVVIGGNFTSFNGTTINRIARLTNLGLLDTAFKVGTATDNIIETISLQPDGKIIITGFFTSYNATTRNRLARLYNCLTPQPDSIYGNSYALCAGTPQTYSVTPVAGAERYEWTLLNGWTGSSDSASIIATSNGSGGTISVKAFTDSCGYSNATTRTIATIQPANVPICLVTVDSQSTHNIIMWEKPQTNLIDSFFIYREITANVYGKVGAVAYDSLSEYHDYAANPNTTSYRYKLSVLDTCGAESEKSPFHNTIHLQNLGSGNFQWTFYQIEPGINPVISFNVYRDNLGNGNFSQIGFIPGTNATFTDINFSSFPNSVYVVDVNWGISCTATRAVSTTRSNIRHRGMIDTLVLIGIAEIGLLHSIEVYPNPSKESITLFVPESVNVIRLQLFNAIGQLVIETVKTKHLNIAAFPKGFYSLSIETNVGRVIRKVFIQ